MLAQNLRTNQKLCWPQLRHTINNKREKNKFRIKQKLNTGTVLIRTDEI